MLTRVTLLAFSIPTLVMAQEARPVPVSPDTLKWADVNNVPGAQSMSLLGRVLPGGVYAYRVKLAAGAKIPPHWHPDARYTQVFSGTVYVGFGETFDESRLVAVPAGSLYIAPARQTHFLWARDGEVIY